MSIFRRMDPRRAAPRGDALPPLREPSLSPDPDPPQGSVGTVCSPEFDPCGAPAIGSKKGGRS